jgi:hypothetical protein
VSACVSVRGQAPECVWVTRVCRHVREGERVCGADGPTGVGSANRDRRTTVADTCHRPSTKKKRCIRVNPIHNAARTYEGDRHTRTRRTHKQKQIGFVCVCVCVLVCVCVCVCMCVCDGGKEREGERTLGAGTKAVAGTVYGART